MDGEQDSKKDNVISLQEACRKSLRKNVDGDSIEQTKFELMKLVAERFNGKINEMPITPPKIAAISSNGSDPYFVLVDDRDVISETTEAIVRDLFLRYCVHPDMHRYGLGVSNAENIFKIWRSTTNVIDENDVADILFDGEPGLCWRRLDWSRFADWPTGPSPTPTWDALLARMSDPDVFLAFIGSMFYPHSDRQQYLWIKSDGGDGKGSITRALMRLFGPTALTLYEPSGEDRFWNSQLVGKRCAILAESNRTSFVMSARFKSLTGNDYVTIERKNRDAYQANLRCKFIVTSNSEPMATRGAANDRRCLLVHLAPLDSKVERLNDVVYGEKLWSEMLYLIMRAFMAYDRLCPDYGPIPITENMKEKWELATYDSEIEFDRAVNSYLTIEKNGRLPGHKMAYIAKEMRWNGFGIRDFATYLERVYGVKKKKDKYGVHYYGVSFSGSVILT